MTTLTNNPKMAQVKQGLSATAKRGMAVVVRNFRNKIIGVIVAAVLAPQASFAGHGGGGHGGGGMSHGSHSSGSSMRSMSRSSGPSKSVQGGMKKQTVQKSPSNIVNRQSTPSGSPKKIIAAKNGSTGINGASAGKQRGSSIRDLMKGDSGKKVAGAGAATANGKFSKSQLLAKYGVKNNGIVNKGNKNPTNPNSNHSNHWCHNGFPLFWGFYSPFGFYPGFPGTNSQPTTVYVDTSVVATDSPSAPTQVAATPQPVTEAPAAPHPTAAEPTAVAPADTTVLTTLPSTTLPAATLASATAASGADLVLEEVRLVEPASTNSGPAYRIKFRNQGTQAAGKFRIGAFAEHDNQLSDDAPQIVTEIAGLTPGQANDVTLRLPVSAMRLVSTSATGSSAFDQLLVIIDLDDSVVEAEKSNNVVNLERTELESLASI